MQKQGEVAKKEQCSNKAGFTQRDIPNNISLHFSAGAKATTQVEDGYYSLSKVPHLAPPWTRTRHTSLSFTVSQSLIKLVSIETMMPSNHLILCHPLLLLPSVFPSIRVLSNESSLWIRRPKYWSPSISPSNEYSGLISFRIDWFDLLAGQGTLKSLYQHHSSKASVLQCSAIFMVQFSHPYMTTGKIIALTPRTFVGKIMSLLFSMMFNFVITFLPRSKCHLILWLQSLYTLILEPEKIKFLTISTFFPIYLPWSYGTWCPILVFWMLSLKPAFLLSSFTFIKRLFSSS